MMAIILALLDAKWQIHKPFNHLEDRLSNLEVSDILNFQNVATFLFYNIVL